MEGDRLRQAIAAASILAKVHRDGLMDRLHATYPGYGFEQHKGYPTRRAPGSTGGARSLPGAPAQFRARAGRACDGASPRRERRPMTPGFVHLHVHTEYSLVDSVVRVPELVAAAAAGGMPAVAITDQGNLFGLVKFYRAALAAGVQPIVGAEVWVAGRPTRARPTARSRRRLVLLCRNQVGYRNLCRLLTRAWLEGQQGGLPLLRAGWLDEGDGRGAHRAVRWP